MTPDDRQFEQQDLGRAFEGTLRELCLAMEPRQAVVDSLRQVLPTARARLYCYDAETRSGHWFCAGMSAQLGAAGILTERSRTLLIDQAPQPARYVRFDGPERREDLVGTLARISGSAHAHGAVHVSMRISDTVVAWLSLDADSEACLERGLTLLQQHEGSISHCLSGQAAFAASFKSSLGASGLLEAIAEPAFLVTRGGIPLACNAPAKTTYGAWPGWLGSGAREQRMPKGVNVIPMKLGDVDMDLVLAKSLERAEAAAQGSGGIRDSWSSELGLTPSLQRVANLMVQGLSDRLIAEQLGLTFNSVRTYARRIYATTGVRNRVELTRLALQASV